MFFSAGTKNSLLLITEKIIVLGLAFLNSVLLARLAGPELFGQFAYIISFTSLFSPLCIMGLNNIATKHFIKHPNNSHYYLLSALTVRASGAVFSIIIGLFIAYSLNMELNQIIKIFTVLALQCFLALNVIEYYFLSKNNVTSPLKIRLSVLVLIGIAKLIVIVHNADLFTLLILHGVEYALIGLGYLWLYYRQGNQNHQKRPIDKRSVLTLFHQGKWLLLSGLAAIVYLKIDQIMIAQFHNNKEVAYYAAAAKLSEFWYVFPVLIANAFSPYLISLHKQNKTKYNSFIVKILSFMVMFALLISALTYTFSNTIIDFIYGNKFNQSIIILNIHIFASIFIFQRAIFSKWLIINGSYKHSLLTHGIGVVVNVVLNLMLIPTFGGVGAAWATFISYMVASFLALFFSQTTREFALLMCNAMTLWPIHVYQYLLFRKNLKEDINAKP